MKVKILSNTYGKNSSGQSNANSNHGQPCQALTGKDLNYDCPEIAQYSVAGCKLCKIHAGEKLLRHFTDPKMKEDGRIGKHEDPLLGSLKWTGGSSSNQRSQIEH